MSPLRSHAPAASRVFYIVGHGVDESLQLRLVDLSRKFFAQDLDAKLGDYLLSKVSRVFPQLRRKAL